MESKLSKPSDTTLEDERVQCELCPRHCRLNDGQRGFCSSRQAIDGEIQLVTYGRSSGFSIDPIEKKTLNHFYPGSSVLSFGTVGCNLACKFCQNWIISKSREMDTLADTAGPERLARGAVEQGCKSIAFTYNEPVVFYEYALDVAAAGRPLGVKSIAVTAGYVEAEARSRFFSAMDAANVDLKAFSDAFYQRLCSARLAPVLDTLQYIHHETACWLEITALLIPGENDSDRELNEMTQWVVEHLGPDVPLHFSAFHPDWKVKDIPPTPPATLARARQIAMANGVRYAFTGNVHDAQGGSTWCPQCGTLLIERDWYQLGHWGLDAEGRCQGCGMRLPGHFNPVPGTFERRQLPVQL